MASLSINSTGNAGTPPCDSGCVEKPANTQDEVAFNQLLGSETPENKPAETQSDSIYYIQGWSEYQATVVNDKPIDIDNYTPEQPDIPKPSERPKDFWGGLKFDIEAAGKKVVNFLGSPEFAQFAKAANVVFAGAMVVTAGVLFATGVGAPAAVAALALAGGAGLAMQMPGISEKIQAGVVAVMEPIIGKEMAEKFGPLMTQGVISASMIAILATGLNANSAAGALDAAMNVFKTMGDVTNSISQVYNTLGPILGIDVNTQAIAQLGSLFSSISAALPDMDKFAKGLGTNLKDFLKNPDISAFLDFAKQAGNIPESLLALMDVPFLNGLGDMIGGIEDLIKSPDLSSLLALLNQLQTLKA